MTDIKAWATSAASNNAASPNGFPEGMAPSGVNDSAREIMAAVRRWYETAQWIDYGHVPTQTGATTFTLASDVTAIYAVGRRLKLTDASTLFGTVTASSYGAPSTTITVALDSGSLSGSLSAVAVGILTPGNVSIPTIAVASGGTGATSAAAALASLGALGLAGGSLSGALNFAQSGNVASGTTTDLSATTGNLVTITGNAAIQSFGTVQPGAHRKLYFSGTPTLKYNATSMILQTGADIVLAAGDTADAYSLGSGNWLVRVERASGLPLKAVTAGTPLVMDPFTVSTTANQAHGLGVEPQICNAVLECKSADAGYSVGERIDLSESVLWHAGVSNIRGYIILKDATNLTVVTLGSLLFVPHRSTHAMTDLTAANWKLIATPYRFE